MTAEIASNKMSCSYLFGYLILEEPTASECFGFEVTIN